MSLATVERTSKSVLRDRPRSCSVALRRLIRRRMKGLLKGGPRCGRALAGLGTATFCTDLPDGGKVPPGFQNDLPGSGKPPPGFRNDFPDSGKVPPSFQNDLPDSRKAPPGFRNGLPDSGTVPPRFRNDLPDGGMALPGFRNGFPDGGMATVAFCRCRLGSAPSRTNAGRVWAGLSQMPPWLYPRLLNDAPWILY